MRDLTRYAKSLGYVGTQSVLVCDGLVMSHHQVDWFTFCHRLRKQA